MEIPVKKSADWLSELKYDGFVVLPNILQAAEVAELIGALDEAGPVASSVRQRGSDTYAIRNLLESFPAVRALAGSPRIQTIIHSVLGPGALPVRGLLFDKTPEANWKVAWHQDLSIAVQQRVDVEGFGPWSVKAGMQHVQPPAWVLERMLTLRLHLDDCGELNGPLQVLSGSHLAGRLNAEQIQAWRQQEAIACTVKVGGGLLMRPLLLHASSAAQNPGHRRVIHLEFAAASLPGGLEWLRS